MQRRNKLFLYTQIRTLGPVLANIFVGFCESRISDVEYPYTSTSRQEKFGSGLDNIFCTILQCLLVLLERYKSMLSV